MSDPKPSGKIETSIVYRIFVGAVTILSLFVAAAYYLWPGPEEVRQVLYILDSLNAFILLGDFFYSLHHAPNRLRHSLTFGWLDLAGSIPGFPFLRLARIPSLIHLRKRLQPETSEELLRDARRQLASSTLLSTVLVVMLVVTVGSISIVLIEKDAPSGNILTGEDAVWWSIVTIATVGYGDRYPTTGEGRLIATAMIIGGVSLFSVLTSFIATGFVARRQSEDRSLDFDTMRAELVRILSTQQLAAERESEGLRAELAEVRRLLQDAAADRSNGAEQVGDDGPADATGSKR